MTTRQRITDFLEGEEALLLEPEMFDDAILGIAERCGQPPIVAYDRQRCIEILMVQDGMNLEEAKSSSSSIRPAPGLVKARRHSSIPGGLSEAEGL